jgi:hypothetical protein
VVFWRTKLQNFGSSLARALEMMREGSFAGMESLQGREAAHAGSTGQRSIY